MEGEAVRARIPSAPLIVVVVVLALLTLSLLASTGVIKVDLTSKNGPPATTCPKPGKGPPPGKNPHGCPPGQTGYLPGRP
jgi:hypothetical protein